MSVFQAAENAIWSNPKDSANQPDRQLVSNLFSNIRYTYDTITSLKASSLSYTQSDAKPVEAGDKILVMEGPWVYTVLASGAGTGIVTTTSNSVELSYSGADADIFATDPAADGSTNDSAKFTWLETNYTGKVVDLRGQTFLVTSIPTGLKYINGGFKIANAIGSNSDVDCIYPADKTFDFEFVKVSQGIENYESWPQGKRHVVNLDGNVAHYSAFNGDAGHSGGKYPFIYVSKDGGITWEYDTIVVQPASDEIVNCWALGEHAGQQLAIIRVADSETSDREEHKLYGRRLHEIRDVTDLEFTTTSGSSTFQITSIEPVDLGVKPGDVMQISGFGTDVNGLNLNSTSTRYTVSSVGTDHVEFVHPDGDTADTTGATTADGKLVFSPDSDDLLFAEMLFDSDTNSLSDHLLANYATQFDNTTIPILFHSIEAWDGSGGLNFKSCAHGGTNSGYEGPYALEFSGVLRGTRAITRADRIGDVTEGGEGTFYRTSAGNWYGGLRGDSPAEPKVWYKSSSNDLTDATIWDLTDGLGNDSPVDVLVDETNSFVYTIMTDTRYRDSTPGPVPLLMGWSTVSAFNASGPSSFTFWNVVDLHFSNTNGDVTPGRNAVGVQSSAIYGNGIYISFSQEHAPIHQDMDGQPGVYDLMIAIGPNGPIGATLPKRNRTVPAKVDRGYLIPQEVGLIGGNVDAVTITKAAEVAYAHRKVLKLPPIIYDIQSQIILTGETEIMGMGSPNLAVRGQYKGPTLLYNISGGTTPMVRAYTTPRINYVGFRGDGTGPAIQLKDETVGSSTYDDTDALINQCHFFNFTFAVDHWNRGLEFTGNAVETITTAAIDLTYDRTNLASSAYPAGGEYGFRAIKVFNNRFHNLPLAIRNTGTENGYLRGFQCHDNMMDLGDSLFQGGLKSGSFVGNMIDLTDTSDAALDFTDPVTGVLITGNHFVGRTAADGDPTSHVWFGDTVENFTITGNLFQNADDSGILFSSTSDNGVISANTFIDIGASSTDGCVHLLGNSNHVSIVGNSFRPINSAYGIRASSGITTTNFTVANNSSDGGSGLVLFNWTAGANTFLQGQTPTPLREYTIATLPSASTFDNTMIIISDETGGRTIATSDGTNWRRVSDGAVAA